MLFVVRNSFSLYVLSMDASIYANEIFTEFVTTETELFSVFCVFPINIYNVFRQQKHGFTGGVLYIDSPSPMERAGASIRISTYR